MSVSVSTELKKNSMAAAMTTVCVSKIGFIVAIAITAMLALVVVIVAYSALLMLDRDNISAYVFRLESNFDTR